MRRRFNRSFHGWLLPMLLLYVGAAAASAQTLPLGFVDEGVVGGLNLPTAFTTLPDGRLLVTEKQGLVRVISNGALLTTPFIDLRASVNDYWDRGLLGIAADPNFSSNGYVYLFHTYENDPTDYSGPKTGRMIRVTATGNVANPASTVVILGTATGRSCHDFAAGADCLPAENPSHSVGNIKVASDGTLFVTTGDGASFNIVDEDALRAQDLDSLAGKVLHITTAGKGVSGNPFWNGNNNANRSKVWAYGLRNPYRIALEPRTNAPYVGDVGWGFWEEINAGIPAGANFGWPCYEGPGRQAGYEPYSLCQALYARGPAAVTGAASPYYHSSGGSAVTAGTFYTGTAFPEQYRGAFFYADYALGFIRYFRVDSRGAIASPVTGFGINLNGPVYLDTDGQHLLYLSVIAGELRRIRYTGASPDVSYLSDRSWTSMTNGWGPMQRDQSNAEDDPFDGRILTLNGVSYPKGLGGHAPSDVRFALGGACSVFAATVGVDDEIAGATADAPATVIFQAFADGVKVFDSGQMNSNSASKAVNVSLSGRNELRLVMLDAGDGNGGDHGDWADARLTCTSADTTPPTVITVSPGDGSSGVAVAANLTATFSEAMTSSTISGATVTLKQGAATVAAAVSYDAASRTVTLDPAADLAGNTVYTATVTGGASGAKDAAGNPLAANRTWTFTTASTGTTVTYLSDRTWTTVENGWGPVEKDRSNAEIAAGDGSPLTLNGVTYAKGLGVHAFSDVRFALGGVCSLLTAQIGIDDEVGANGSAIFQVFTGSATTPVYDSGVMTGTSATKTLSVNLAGASTLRLVVAMGPEGNSSNHADWADAKVTCSSNGDTTPPTVTSVSPGAGSTGAAVNTNVSATFSEPMMPSTLTTTTATLVVQGSTTTIPATVSYSAAANSVTLDPTADLAGNTTYVARIKSGATGAKDATGNAIAADYSWAFTTASSGVTVTYLSDRAWTEIENGWGPVEKDRSNGQTGPTDGGTLTLDGITYAKGLGVHAASDIRFALGASCTLFTAQIGIDDEVGADGSVIFQVYRDAGTTPLFDSGVMFGTTPTKSVSVNITGFNTLRLVVAMGPEGNSSDHADWADAKVTCSNSGDSTAPTVTAVGPAAGSIGAPSNTNVTATFSEAMGSATLNSSTVMLAPASGAPVSATVTYSAATNTVTLAPAAALLANTVYTATIKGGSGGAKDAAGNPLAADRVWTFRTNAPPAPAVTQPASSYRFKVGDVVTYGGAASDPEDGSLPGSRLSWSVVLQHCPGGNCHAHPFTTSTGSTGSFTAPDHGDDSFFEVTLTATDSGGLTRTTTVTIQPQTVTFTLNTSPSGLQVIYSGTTATAPATFTTIAGSTHTIQVASPQGGFTFANWSDGGAQQHNVQVGTTNVSYTAVFTGQGGVGTTTYLSDRSWTTVQNGWGPVEKDRSNGEMGAADGGPLTLNGIVYPKGLGVHAASDVRFALGGACSAMTAQIGVDDEVGANGSAIFQVFADNAATPLYDSGVMTGTAATKSVSVNLTGVNTLRLVVAMGPEGNSSDHADWADAKVTCSTGGDTTPPVVTAVSPVAGANNVVVNANVTAVFSEAMDAATLTAATVTLQQGAAAALAASVTYNAATNTVTLDPAANLAGNTAYTVTIKSGSSGVKDAAGNALVTNRVWSFTTGATGTTVTYLSDRPWTEIENGWGPVEKDRSNGQTGPNDGTTLTLNGVSYAKGLGAHAPSEVRFNLAGACSLLTAQVGIDDEIVIDGSVNFQVFADGAATPLYDSGVMTYSTATKAMSVNIAGVNVLRLVVAAGPDGNGSDHGDWADAKITCQGATGTAAP